MKTSTKSISEIRELVEGMIEVADVPKGLYPYTRLALSPSMLIKRVEEVAKYLKEMEESSK